MERKKRVATIEGNWDSVVRWGLGSKADSVPLDVSPSVPPVSEKIIAPRASNCPMNPASCGHVYPEAIRARDMDTATAHKASLPVASARVECVLV